jgi:hypothetical protein
VVFFARRNLYASFLRGFVAKFVRGFVRDWFLDEKIACKIARIAGSSADRIAGKVFIKKEKASAPSKIVHRTNS